MASEPRLVILQPKRELRIMRIRARQEIVKDVQLLACLGCVVVELVVIIAWLAGTYNSNPIFNPAPGWVHWCKWIELAASILAALVISGAAIHRRQLTAEKHRLSQQREQCVLTDAELQQLAAQLEAACDTALTESNGLWDDTLLILQLRYQGYTQLLEAQSGVHTTDSFKLTLEEVEAIRVRLVQQRQTKALAT